ncbi:MAG TPA: 4a-hydroxytetrahydrobiopterin dehydratase [Acidobacteriaceae bacterium]
MKKLDAGELEQALKSAPAWGLAGGKLQREWTFKDFVAAMKFVNRVAEIAEEAGHHPDIDIRYNRVTLGLVTHDAGGITAKDAEMAARLGREL